MLTLVLLGLADHTLDILLRETALVVVDGDTVRLAGGLVRSGNVQDTIGVDIEGDLDLRNTTGRRRDTGELELAEQVVVLGTGTLTLEYLDEHTGLVVGVSREDPILLGGDGGVTLDKGGHDTTSGLNTKGKRGNIEEEVLGLLESVARENGGLDDGTVSVIGVDGLARLLAVEEVGDKLDNMGIRVGTADEGDLVNVGLVDRGVAEDLLDGLESGAEQVLAELLETGTSE